MPPARATAAPRTAPPERAAARPRAARPRDPVAKPLAVAPAPKDAAATTRDRMRASFTAGSRPPLQVVPEATEGAPELLPARTPAAPLTTRERVARSVRTAAPEPPAAPLAPVVDLAAAREQRDRRESAPAPAPPAGGATVLPLARPGGTQARGPPERAPPAVAKPPEATATAAETSTDAARPAPGPNGPALAHAPQAGVAAPAPEGTPEAAPQAAATPAGPAAAAADPAAAAADPAAAAADPAAAAADPATAGPEAAAAPVPKAGPEDDPAFVAMKARARRAAVTARAHQPAEEGAATAYAAAEPPENDVESQAAAAQVGVMSGMHPAEFDRAAFIEAVKQAVAAATPSTLEDVDEFKESGAMSQATEMLHAKVAAGKQSSEHDIRAATEAEPDRGAAVEKPVADMVNDAPGSPPEGVGAANAMPQPRPAGETDLSSGPAKVDAEMATAGVTEPQLARSNEPDFAAALESRDRAREHAQTAPAETRTQEETILAQAREAASGEAAAGLQAMHHGRVSALDGALAQKQDARSTHEQEHARIAAELETIYVDTQTAVREILGGLDAKVDDEFTRGEQAARTAFEDYVDTRMREYKADRYDRFGGGVLWLKDKIAGMPDEVDAFYSEGRAGYLRAMDAVIERIANLVGSELTAARARIVEGQAAVAAYVKGLDDSVIAVGLATQEKLQGKFEQLGSEVDDHQAAVVDSVARRYVESRDAVDERIEELKAANQGLVAAAIDAVAGVIRTIVALGEMLLRVLAKAAEVVGDIVADPIGFLGNLVEGVMRGLNRFVDRIWTHLENALAEWLFGSLGRGGITLPAQLDGPGVLSLVLQVIGLTYAGIRARVAKSVGEPVVAAMEQGVELFQTMSAGGLGALWELIADKVGDLQQMVLGRIKEWVVERIIKGGIAWIIGLLNPVAAFIKACKAIYEIVTFIADRARQIGEFVEAVLDSISAIAKGDLGAAEEKVERSLASALPLAIGFLAALLNIGDVSEKVMSIVGAVRRPVERAVDAVVLGLARAYKRTFGRAEGRPAPHELPRETKRAVAAVPAAAAPAGAAPEPQRADKVEEHVGFKFGRESHELFGELVGGDARVSMASGKRASLDLSLADVQREAEARYAAAGPLGTEAVARLRDDIRRYTQQDAAGLADVENEAPEYRQRALMRHLLDMRTELENLARAHGLPGTSWRDVDHSFKSRGAPSYERVKGVDATLCIFSWQEGSRAYQDPPGRELSTFDGRVYQRGHLLANALGGPGNATNLAMVSLPANTAMRVRPELQARYNLDPSLKRPEYSPENLLSFEAEVSYDDPADTKALEQYLKLHRIRPTAYDDLFAIAQANEEFNRETISSRLVWALTEAQYRRLGQLWRRAFLASRIVIRMEVLQGRARVGASYDIDPHQ